MWVRSQDLCTLVKCEQISIQDDGRRYNIVECGCIVLGSYTTGKKLY